MKLVWLAALYLLSWGAFAAEIPVIDFFKHAEVKSMQISPEGTHVAFTYEKGDQVPLAIMDLKTKKITASFELGDQKHVLWFLWANKERVVFAVAKVTGNLDNMGRPSAWYAANVDGSKRRRIYDSQGGAFSIVDVLRDDPKHVLLSKRPWADERGAKATLLNVYDGELDYIADQPNVSDNGYLWGLDADTSGKIRVAFESVDAKTDNLDDNYNIIHIKKNDNWAKLTVPNVRPVKPEITPVGFSEDNSKLYFLSNHDMVKNDRSGLFRYDFSTGKIELVYRHPEVDVLGVLRGHNEDVIGVVTMPGRFEKQYIETDASDAAFLQALDAAFPGQYVRVTSYTYDGKQAMVQVSSDQNPGEFFLFDVKKRTAKFIAASLPHIKANDMQAMEPVEFNARDGVKIHALLTRARNAQGPSPLVVLVHGGPYGIVDTWGYDREAQVLSSRGYAVLQVNYRGSGGYGQDFERLGRLEWGGKMQDDVTDATLWAVEQGIADRERLCIYGGSYGGYAALQGVIREPDLYKCAIGFVGVYDMLWFRDGDGSDGDNRGYDADRFGEQWMNAHLGDDREQLRSRSPVHNVDKIKANLFIVHGDDDVRVPIGHAYRLRDALDKIGKKYEWMVVDKEGHGFVKPENNEKLFNKIFEVLEKSVGKPKM